jgi:hypothetical protein
MGDGVRACSLALIEVHVFEKFNRSISVWRAPPRRIFLAGVAW